MRYNQVILKGKLAKLLAQLKERGEKIALDPANATGLAEWGAVGDTLDEIKDTGWAFAPNPAPEWLVAEYRDARTTLREIIPLIIDDPTDEYACRTLFSLVRRLDRMPLTDPTTART